jgi:3-deoxy-D-manno-octulosonic-acid transferase
MRRRVVQGKENRQRLNERFARDLTHRPQGKLIWCHGASVGETQLLLETAAQLLKTRSDISFIFTCQTLTGADTITNIINHNPDLKHAWARQQMAPVDTPRAAKRFIAHWMPDVAVFAEGEIWPNLLGELDEREIPTALINARMTDKTINNWRRWPKTAHWVFSTFKLIIAGDKRTATALKDITGQDIATPGNLKSALPLPPVDEHLLTKLQTRIGQRHIIVAASTHEGEEALIIDTVMQMTPKPFLIIAPRHPERGDRVATLLDMSGMQYERRSDETTLNMNGDVLLADTMGEMGLWYRLADTVYLGGGHTPGVGGHNPLEPIMLGKPVMTGPSLFNFEDIKTRLRKAEALTIVSTAGDMLEAMPLSPPSDRLLAELKTEALGPMAYTLSALIPLLPPEAIV